MLAFLLAFLFCVSQPAPQLPAPHPSKREQGRDSWKPIDERGLYLVKSGIDGTGDEFRVYGLVRGDSLTLTRALGKYQGPFLSCFRTAVQLDEPRYRVLASGERVGPFSVILIGSGERLVLLRAAQ